MKRASIYGSVALAGFMTMTGCQIGGSERPSTDMSEWEVAESRKTSVSATEPPRLEPSSEPPVRRSEVDSSSSAASYGHSARHGLIGKTCRVQFRRDALGMAVTAPLPATSEGVGGRPAYIDGTVTAVSESWITLSRDGVSYDIPHGAILLIESR